LGVVVRNIHRPAAELVARFQGLGVATIHEAQGRKGLLAPSMRPVWRRAHVAGPAVTVSIPPADNWMIHVAVEQCQAGDVLVVAPTSASDTGYFGELLATSLASRGVLGLVIDAGVRDAAALEDMKFPVWSSSISAQGTVKETLGDVNRPICCAGAFIRAGDLIVADDDGVVVVPRADAAEVLELSLAREAKEDSVRKRLEAGELGLDIYGMRPRLAEKGLVYLDGPED
jgi:4-hydroxy-4-methyl-2-oxoglutarate aldolase